MPDLIDKSGTRHKGGEAPPCGNSFRRILPCYSLFDKLDKCDKLYQQLLVK